MGLQPRQQLYIVGGIAALFAVLTILFIILFATKKCDKCNCADSANYNSMVLQLSKNQNLTVLKSNFTSGGYNVFLLQRLESSNSSYDLFVVTYTPAQSAAMVLTKLNLSNANAVDGNSSSTVGTGLCPITTIPTTSGPTTTPYTGTTTPYTGSTTTTTTTTTPATTTTPCTCTSPVPTTPFTGTTTTRAPTTPFTGSTTTPPTQPQQTTCGPVPTNPLPGTICSSVVKDFVFIIDIMPDVQGNAAKASEISSALTSLASRVNFGDSGTRFGLVGFFDLTATGVDMYNNYKDFSTAVSNLVGRISSTNGGSYGNLGAAFTSVQKYLAFRPSVDVVLIIISDHPPVSLDVNGIPITSSVTQTAVDLTREKGYYIGAITPVADTFSTVSSHYESIVSTKYLLATGIASYTGFSSSVQNYLLRTVCGYVSNPNVPMTTYAPTSPLPTIAISTSTMMTTTAPSLTVEWRCRPVNLIFVLDVSQSITGAYFNSTVKPFVKMIAAAYPMKGEINGTSSRIGVVQFANYSTVTYNMKERTRAEFESTIDQSVYYSTEGTTNISLGLETALDELNRTGVIAKDNVMVILVTDGVSTTDIRQTEPSAKKVRAFTDFFAGVGINGTNGNDISANLTNLQLLIGNNDTAFADISQAEDPLTGIWPKSRKTYPCQPPACKGVIFIGEMTEVIAQQRKEIFLNSTKQIAAFLNGTPGDSTNATQLRFSIATYGDGIISPIKLKPYNEFSTELEALITDVTLNNNPNDGSTRTGNILEDLYNVVTSGQLQNYLVLFMGETEKILDLQLTNENVKKVAATTAEIFVLDMTNGNWANDYLFQYLVNNNMNKLYNYSGQSVTELTNFYTSSANLFDQKWSIMNCTVPTLSVCNAFFDMFLVVKQSTTSETSLQTIATYLNSQYTAISGLVRFTQRGLVQYGTGSNLFNSLTFDTHNINSSIQNLAIDIFAANNYDKGYITASGQMQLHAATRYYAQNIIVIISDVYPVNDIDIDGACNRLTNAINGWPYVQNAPVVYYITTSPQGNQVPCPVIESNIISVQIANNPAADNSQMSSIITRICSTLLAPLSCPCTATDTNSQKNFLQRYFG